MDKPKLKKKKETKITFSYECPYCGKEFKSENKKQLDYNFGLHLESCRRKNERN